MVNNPRALGNSPVTGCLLRSNPRLIPRLLAAVLLLSAATTGLGEDAAAPEPNPHIGSHLEMLNLWIAAQVKKAAIPGLAVAIVHDQDVVLCRGYGYADMEHKTKVTPQTLFRVASLSKMFTAIAIMQLRDAEKLGLDDNASKHLPWLQLKDPEGDPATVTIRQLLTHTSGLSSLVLSERPFWTDFRFPEMDEIRGDLVGRRLAFPPGEQLKYSNLAYCLLGAIVEELSEQPSGEYVDNHVLKPLGMAESRMAVAADAQNLSHGYGPLRDGSREPIPFVDAKSLATVTGLAASASDLAKFMKWQLRLLSSNDTDVLAASTLREMQHAHRVNASWEFGYGYCFRVMRHDEGEHVGHHCGNTVFVGPNT